MWYSFFSYFRYLFRSKTKYSVHSPFVFDFITKGIGVAIPKQMTLALNSYRRALDKDSRFIKITDFGAGSKVFKSNIRPVKKIAKYAGISKTKSVLLQKIVNYYKPIKILELGTSLGIASAAMQIANQKAIITSIEGCPETAKTAKYYLNKQRLNSIDIKIGKFSDSIPDIINDCLFDMIYFDGNHQKEATIDYFKMCLQSIHNDSFFIFDDIHWSKEMEEAWGYIYQHPKVSVSIDLFYLGLVFFRKEQTKQHFILR
jgi:predicted O-methyltransferase YrrM